MDILCDSQLDKLLNKIVVIKTNNNLYLHVHNICQQNIHPTFILTPNNFEATEFILIKKNNNSFAIRLNYDIKNQNNTFGYHLYTSPDSDLVFGSGDDGLFANFLLFKQNNDLFIKSIYKDVFLSHEYNVLRFRPFNQNNCSFSIETRKEIYTPITEQSICVVVFGYLYEELNLDNSNLLNDLSERYNNQNLHVYFYLFNTENKQITSSTNKFKLYINNHNNNDDFFIMKSINLGLTETTTSGFYTHKLLELFWNISNAVSFATKQRMYDNYMLLNIDAVNKIKVINKNFDLSRYYCLNEGIFNFYFSVGKFVQRLNYLYDFFVKNKLLYTNMLPEKIILAFLKSQNVITCEIHSITTFNTIAKLQKYCDDDYLQEIKQKYIDLSFI